LISQVDGKMQKIFNLKQPPLLVSTQAPFQGYLTSNNPREVLPHA
jgi:hypothetical protein